MGSFAHSSSPPHNLLPPCKNQHARHGANTCEGNTMGTAPTFNKLENVCHIVMYGTQYDPHYRLLVGGGRTQGILITSGVGEKGLFGGFLRR